MPWTGAKAVLAIGMASYDDTHPEISLLDRAAGWGRCAGAGGESPERYPAVGHNGLWPGARRLGGVRTARTRDDAQGHRDPAPDNNASYEDSGDKAGVRPVRYRFTSLLVRMDRRDDRLAWRAIRRITSHVARRRRRSSFREQHDARLGQRRQL